MLLYASLLVIHILSAVVWLGMAVTDFILRKEIKNNAGSPTEFTLISLWLRITNLSASIGLAGIVLTGILLSIQLGYGFFQFASGANHWLYTKQFIIVIIIALTGMTIIPAAKEIRIKLQENNNSDLSKLVKNLSVKFNIIHILVLINLLLAVTRKFIPVL